MKKMLSIMLATILLLTSLAIPTYAEEPVLFELVLPNSYEHGTDEVIVAEIHVKNNVSGISAATFYIDLPECLTTQTENAEESINATDLLVGYFATGGWASDGDHRLSAGFMGLKALKGDGALLTINLVPTADATKDDLEKMTVTLGARETKTADGTTHKGEDDDVQVSKSPIETPEISCTHPEIENVKGKPATCTEPGYSDGKKCKFCGEPIGDTEIYPALNHDFKYEETLEEATCTKVGKDLYKCSRCGETEEREVNMIPHSPDTDWHTEEGSKEHWHNCISCGKKIDDTVTAHTYAEYTTTETEHTHVCTACKATETTKHSGGKASCTKKAVCEVCNTEYGEVDKTNHADGIDETAWENDENNHWHVCKYCKEITGTASHKESADYKQDGTNHWHYCTVCGYEFEKTAHSTSKAIECDPTGHWKVCDGCGGKFDFDAHTKAVLMPEKKPTSLEDGNVAYWYCPDCGKYFYDDSGKIGAGPYDTTDQFMTKYNAGCNGNHQLVCVPTSGMYHMFICHRQCGFVLTMPHNFGLNGVCHDCGYVLRVSENSNDNVVEVETPTEGKINYEEIEIVG